METLSELIRFQASGIKIAKYENEFLTMVAVTNNGPKVVTNFLRLQTLEWLNSLNQSPKNVSDLTIQSTNFRKLGNDLLRTAPKQNALTACRYYTKAIFVAPLGESLALAHANRAICLQKFGYFKQAYDDCECALEQGYPSKMRHKLWTRQAICAYHLNDAVLLEQHLNALGEMKLNKEYSSQLSQLSQGLVDLRLSVEGKHVKKNCEQKEHHKTQILKDDIKGRYMVATKFIAENDIIFTESATSFVPVGNGYLCQECASTLFIPFPCYRCDGKVVYCSLQCKRAHHSIHAYECVAYQRDLFAHVGIAHLALRLVLDNMPQLATTLPNKSSTELIWRELSQNTTTDHNSSSTYEHTVRLVTHLDKMPLSDILWFAIVSNILVLYLSEFTTFFLSFSESEVTLNDWKLLAGSLILRHIGQLIVNGHSCISICRNTIPQTLEHLDFTLMSDDLWASPLHVRRGFLHQFSNFVEVAAANFPYLSMCNHACSQSFQLKYSGRCISTFASRPIQAGDEVHNCYTLDYRKSRKNVRRNNLKDTYHFSCDCSQCKKETDDEYEKFHRYRCDHPNCQKIFILELFRDDNRWELIDTRIVIKCSVCNAPQFWHERHVRFHTLLKRVKSRDARQKLYKYFNSLDDFLVDYNMLKLIYAHQIITECFEMHIAASNLSDDDFLNLVHILKFYLRGIAAQSSTNSIEYVVNMTYLWDFVALGKYKPYDEEMAEMLLAIEFVSDEMKTLLENYYNDYIVAKLEPKLSSFK